VHVPALFNAVCQHDLGGIVAKLARSGCDVTAPTWIKVKNPTYSQREGRHDLFERRKIPRRYPRQPTLAASGEQP